MGPDLPDVPALVGFCPLCPSPIVSWDGCAPCHFSQRDVLCQESRMSQALGDSVVSEPIQSPLFDRAPARPAVRLGNQLLSVTSSQGISTRPRGKPPARGCGRRAEREQKSLSDWGMSPGQSPGQGRAVSSLAPTRLPCCPGVSFETAFETLLFQKSFWGHESGCCFLSSLRNRQLCCPCCTLPRAAMTACMSSSGCKG